MNSLYARSVFFVENTERARRFYTEQLGFSADWGSPEEDGVNYVCQVSLLGFELILNQVEPETKTRAGHGRLFIGLDEDQAAPFLAHIAAHGIPTERVGWGRWTYVIKDLDGNELFIWPPRDDWAGFETLASTSRSNVA